MHAGQASGHGRCCSARIEAFDTATRHGGKAGAGVTTLTNHRCAEIAELEDQRASIATAAYKDVVAVHIAMEDGATANTADPGRMKVDQRAHDRLRDGDDVGWTTSGRKPVSWG